MSSFFKKHCVAPIFRIFRNLDSHTNSHSKKGRLMTYNELMNWTFDQCVHLLNVMAYHAGMTYNEINIWIFVIIEPVVFVCMCYYILRLRHRIRRWDSVDQRLSSDPDYYPPYLPLASAEVIARRHSVS